MGGETVFYPHDRRSKKEEIAVSLETGMLLLHKHGDDCMLVSLPFVFSSSMLRVLTSHDDSTKEEKSQLARSGLSELICASESRIMALPVYLTGNA